MKKIIKKYNFKHSEWINLLALSENLSIEEFRKDHYFQGGDFQLCLSLAGITKIKNRNVKIIRKDEIGAPIYFDGIKKWTLQDIQKYDPILEYEITWLDNSMIKKMDTILAKIGIENQ